MFLSRQWAHAIRVRQRDDGESDLIMNDVHHAFHRHGLVRPRSGRVLGGVCAGLGQRFGFSPWMARLLFTLILMAVPGSQILLYPILWILIPSEEQVAAAGFVAKPTY